MRNLLIIEHEDSVRDDLGLYTKELGYKPILISDPLVCNAVKSVGQQCHTKKPCAEFLLIDNDCPVIDGLSLIELQAEKGCTVNKQRKALMASTLTDKEHKKATTLGCHVIPKPVTYKALENWLKGLESPAV
jgi:DNA-binding response OmpR family regulator